MNEDTFDGIPPVKPAADAWKSALSELMVRRPTFVLLWELDNKNRPARPHVVFTPSFPGEGFNHSVQIVSAATVYKAPCPCGTELLFKGGHLCAEVMYSTERCPTCESWHSFKWIPLCLP